MFGSYQAGVWKELAPHLKPDIVIGASVGCLNGYRIASGADPDEIIDEWLRLGEAARLRFRFPRSLSDGILASGALERRLERLCSEHAPRIPFGVVATALPGLTPRLFRWPDLTWKHLAASCAVPLFLKQHRLDGALYADGGLLDPLPLWAAVEMGATRIIAVNALEHRPLPVRAGVRLINRLSRFRYEIPAEVELIRIAPAASLGAVRDAAYWDAGRCRRWIELGRKDALSKNISG